MLHVFSLYFSCVTFYFQAPAGALYLSQQHHVKYYPHFIGHFLGEPGSSIYFPPLAMEENLQELEKTALDRGWTHCISLTHDFDPDLQSPASYGHDLRACKIQSEWSVGSMHSSLCCHLKTSFHNLLAYLTQAFSALTLLVGRQ